VTTLIEFLIVKRKKVLSWRTHPPAPSLCRCIQRTARRKGWLFAEHPAI